jgi:hypothetical protein
MFSRRSPVEVEGKAERNRSAITFDNLTLPNARAAKSSAFVARSFQRPALRPAIRSKSMKRITFALATALILGALTIALPKVKSDVKANPVAPSAALTFADPCTNVKARFKNQHYSGGQIKFQRIKFYNHDSGNWYTEDVNNLICNQDQLCTTAGNNLRDSEGENLTKFQLIYKYKGPGSAANWSGEVISPVFSVTAGNERCTANKMYGGPSWAVTGRSN